MILKSWLETLGRLGWYFQVAGTLSVIAWLSVLAVLAVFAFSIHRLVFYFAAAVLCGVGVLMGYILAGPMAAVIWAGLAGAVAAGWRHVPRSALCAAVAGWALLGVVLAGINSDAVSEIEVDRTEQLLAARRRQAKLRAERIQKIKSTAADIHFPEDTAADRLDLAGKTTTQAALLAADRATTRAAADVPEYKKRGKRSRDAGRKAGGGDFADLEGAVAGGVRAGRMMKAWDVIRANRLDRVNLFAVRYGLLVALLMLATDYLSRFNRTFGALLPVPVAGRLVDALFAKTHAVLVESADDDALRAYLQTAIRKGETFVYFGPADPWRDVEGPTGGVNLPAMLSGLLRRRGQGPPGPCRLPLGLLPVTKVVCGAAGACGSGFLFESAWFGRYCFVVEGAESARRVLPDLLAHLRARHRSGASAGRTVHLVWHLHEPPNPELLPELVRLCKETNFKLLLFSPAAPRARDAFHFEERFGLDSSGQAHLLPGDG